MHALHFQSSFEMHGASGCKGLTGVELLVEVCLHSMLSVDRFAVQMICCMGKHGPVVQKFARGGGGGRAFEVHCVERRVM